MMKLTKIALALALTSTASVAIAAPSPSAYDRIQDARANVTSDLINDHQNQITQNKLDSETRDTQLGDRITSVDADLQSTKLGVIAVDQKADAAQQEASSALDMAGSAKTDAQAALNGLADKVDQTAYDADKAAQAVRDNDQDALISTNSDKADAALAGVATNGSAIIDLQTKAGTFATKPELDAGLATKVNATDFVADQARQDTAITESNTKSDAALAGVVNNGVAITNETNDRKAADADLQAQVNDRVTTSVFSDDQKRQDAALAAETSTRSSQFTTLSAGVKQAQDTGAYAQSRADSAYAHSEANRQALDATNKRVAQNTADIANHEQRIQGLESQTNSKFADLNKQIDDNRKRASAGIAGVAAMANIPQVLEHQTFAIGAGAGNTDGESALAVGFSARASQNTVVKASVSNDTQHNFVIGAGVSYGW
ncbi:hypothetical protein ECML606-1_000082 [Escherichia phage ECML-606-1]|nr:hypothetical protein ECML606-1_000082 [Escherichia phage ECML-606-1]